MEMESSLLNLFLSFELEISIKKMNFVIFSIKYYLHAMYILKNEIKYFYVFQCFCKVKLFFSGKISENNGRLSCIQFLISLLQKLFFNMPWKTFHSKAQNSLFIFVFHVKVHHNSRKFFIFDTL